MFNSYGEYISYLKSGANLNKSEFDKKLISTKYKILGLKLPDLRTFAKQLIKNGDSDLILSNKNFTYYEELLIFSFVLSNIKIDEKERILRIKDFLVNIDNWSNCDSFCSSLKVVSKNKNNDSWDWYGVEVYYHNGDIKTKIMERYKIIGMTFSIDK